MAEGAGDREQELAALHRSYRNMENDRQKYSEESQVPSRTRTTSSPHLGLFRLHSRCARGCACMLSLVSG